VRGFAAWANLNGLFLPYISDFANPVPLVHPAYRLDRTILDCLLNFFLIGFVVDSLQNRRLSVVQFKNYRTKRLAGPAADAKISVYFWFHIF
jgi:hypothetical protein